MSGKRLTNDFYRRTDVVQVARELLGKVLVTQFERIRTAGIITEVEAYRAPDDRACHAWNNRRTKRTEVMFREGGTAYIYLCYGIHHLFNVVTAPEDVAHAILIRAVEPLEGLEFMRLRRQTPPPTPPLKERGDVEYTATGSPVYSTRGDVEGAAVSRLRFSPGKGQGAGFQGSLFHRLTTGPGALSQALGLSTAWTGQSLTDPETPVWIEDRGRIIPETSIVAGPRIGVDYAGECAAWEWRFWLRDSAFVTRKK